LNSFVYFTADDGEDITAVMVNNDDSWTDEDLVYCCHLCRNIYTDRPDFSAHLRDDHPPTSTTGVVPKPLPVLEILPEMGEGELTLQRCGFCSYESFFEEDFDAHVQTHDAPPALKCAHCTFASFSATDIEAHSALAHVELASKVILINQPYTMTPPEENEGDGGVGEKVDGGLKKLSMSRLFDFDGTIRLVDIEMDQEL